MTPTRTGLDVLLDQAGTGMDSALTRLRKLMPDEARESWDLEREAFGIQDPKTVEAELREEERKAKLEPVVDTPSRSSWRELFRKRWPDGPRKGRR